MYKTRTNHREFRRLDNVAQYIRKCAVSLCIIAATAGCSVLTGTNTTRQIDGSINDSDNSTSAAGSYSSTGASANRVDGLSEAKSNALSHQSLDGYVTLIIDSNSQGPFSGTPAGASSQKVRSDFPISANTKVQFKLNPTFSINIDSTSHVVVSIALWVLTGPRGTSVPGSVYTARYEFTEDPNNITEQIVDIAYSNAGVTQGSGSDGVSITDNKVKPNPFMLTPGTYTAQYELNISASGDTTYTTAHVYGKMDLVRVP